MAQPWFRFYHEALDDPKVQSLPAETFKGWVNMLCLACRNDGKLPDLIAVSFAFRMSEFETEKLFHELESLRLIDRKRGTLTPHKWNERQYKSDVSTDRVKEFRKRKRNVSLVLHETPPEQIQNRTDTEQNRTEGNRGVKHAPRSKPKTPTPETFEVTPEIRDWASKQNPPFTESEIRQEIPQFLDHHRKKGDTFADWVAALRTWMRNSRKFAPTKTGSKNTGGMIAKPKPHDPLHFCGSCDIPHEWTCDDPWCNRDRDSLCLEFIRKYNTGRTQSA